MGLDYQLWWVLSMVFGVVVIVLWTTYLVRNPRGRLARGLRSWFIGLDGEEFVAVSEAVPPPVGSLAADIEDAIDFCMHSRVPSDRAVVTCDSRAVMLDARGTDIVTGLVAAGPRRARRVLRIFTEQRVLGWIRSGAPGFSDISDADPAALAVASAWEENGAAMRLKIGGASVLLDERGSQVLAGLLVAPHRMVNRAAAALGAEDRIGWADWLPSHREVHDVRHDAYLDHKVDPWTFGRRPRRGGKIERHRT
ncbi:hypothetical protein [uncultured Demequina sp.]|uniref:hypothetical protein n=1 Tax=uncultured Demequina sp. TaxID=693499 RepID=UPI00260133AD|nr:hypothetical protein [uncultured Demequina sp.]